MNDLARAVSDRAGPSQRQLRQRRSTLREYEPAAPNPANGMAPTAVGIVAPTAPGPACSSAGLELGTRLVAQRDGRQRSVKERSAEIQGALRANHLEAPRDGQRGDGRHGGRRWCGKPARESTKPPDSRSNGRQGGLFPARTRGDSLSSERTRTAVPIRKLAATIRLPERYPLSRKGRSGSSVMSGLARVMTPSRLQAECVWGGGCGGSRAGFTPPRDGQPTPGHGECRRDAQHRDLVDQENATGVGMCG